MHRVSVETHRSALDEDRLHPIAVMRVAVNGTQGTAREERTWSASRETQTATIPSNIVIGQSVVRLGGRLAHCDFCVQCARNRSHL